MTPTPPEILNQLHDIHLPPPVPFWPPAPGWWGLAALILILAAVALWWRQRRKKTPPTPPWLPLALAEVDRLEQAFTHHGDGRQLATQLSHLLKQVALTRFDRLQVAPLWGENWLAFLDETGHDTRFTSGPGRPLGEAAFRPELPVEPQPMLELARQWLHHVLRDDHP